MADVKKTQAKPSAYREQYGVIVVSKTEDENRRIFEWLQGHDLACRVVTT